MRKQPPGIQEATPPPDTGDTSALVLDFPDPRIVRNKCLPFNEPCPWCLLQQTTLGKILGLSWDDLNSQ